jgi:quinol monooxygenase YgiN
MSKKAIFVRLKAKSGMEAELKSFLENALPLAEEEPGTKTWFALQFDESTFGIFDTFDTDEGRSAHINGPIAAALLANAERLLAVLPKIEKVDLLASKLP